MNKYSVNSQTLKIISFFVCFVFVFFSTLSLTSGLPPAENTVQTAVEVDKVIKESRGIFPVIVIDPGHGGRDGGASSDNGVLEKDINLQISALISRLCGAFGFECVMTRTEDVMLGEELAGNKRKMKDLKSRVNTANSLSDCIFISIHQNKFPQKKYSGLQTYYSKNSPLSKQLAQSIQTAVKQNLQSDNDRAVKPAGSSIYVLDNIIHPAVLVECGFLSNDGEVLLLCDSVYQKKLSASVFSALFNYLQEYPK